jgi:cyclase
MLKTRIIPVITWNGLTAVHTVGFAKPQSAGSIWQALKVYERRACDELMILDIEATRRGTGPDFECMSKFSGDIFCPMTIGGGISKPEEVRRLIACGADKVVIGRAANRQLIEACSRKFGAQSIVAAMDVDPQAPLEAQVALALWFEHVGAGEILLTSIRQQGSRKGYDLGLIHAIAGAVKIPVVANGGCGHPQHMLDALNAGAHAVAACSMFAFTQWTPKDCAKFLHEAGIPVRLD